MTTNIKDVCQVLRTNHYEQFAEDLERIFERITGNKIEKGKKEFGLMKTGDAATGLKGLTSIPSAMHIAMFFMLVWLCLHGG